MDFINSYIRPAFVPLLLTAVMLLLLAILYNVRCTRLMKVHGNTQHKEKEPEEHDERFATGRYFCNEVDFFIIVIILVFIQKALIIGFYAYLWHSTDSNINNFILAFALYDTAWINHHKNCSGHFNAKLC